MVPEDRRQASFLQLSGNVRKLFERGLQIFSDFLGQHFWGRQILAVFERVVFEPEDVEVGFVAFDDLVVGEAAPAALR